jgi:hypothetical protein
VEIDGGGEDWKRERGKSGREEGGERGREAWEEELRGRDTREGECSGRLIGRLIGREERGGGSQKSVYVSTCVPLDALMYQ